MTPQILLVDDVPSARKVLANLLRRIGYTQLVEAPDGEAALALTEHTHFDIIISDWHMPKMNGLQLLGKLREKNGPLKNVPFLIITSSTDREDVIEAIKAGVSDYICKPFTVDILQGKIDKVLPKILNES